MKTVNANLADLYFEQWFRKRENRQIVWTTRDGKVIPINDMTDEHLDNTINMLMRQIEEEEAEQAIFDDLRGLDPNDL